MARTIESPGVEIREVDLSLRSTLPTGTKILVHGFASQGPTNELILVSTKNELDEIFFGNTGPTNAAERYFYYSCAEVLNSPATLYVTRFPYGSGTGTGFDGDYTALCYPVTGVGGTATFGASLSYAIGTPVVAPITETQYNNLKSGSMTWNVSTGGTLGSTYYTVSNAGFVIVNDVKTTINEKYEGYYLALADNTTNILSGYSQISGVNTLGSSNTIASLATTLLGFNLSGTASEESMSEVVETAVPYDFSDTTYRDSLIAYLWRLRTSPSSPDINKLYAAPVESFAGSLNAIDQRVNKNGTIDSYSLADKINNNSNYIKMFVNPNIATNVGYDTVRNNKIIGQATNVNPIGNYQPCQTTATSLKNIGKIPDKIDRALALAENIQDIDIDIVPAAGLETIWAYVESTSSDGSTTFDDAANMSTDISSLITAGMSSDFYTAHSTVFNKYNNFCQLTRKDCIHYSDPIRGVYIQGENFKTLDDKTKNFNQHILNPMKALYAASNSNYSATYATWVKIFDTNSNKVVWLPFSGYQAAITARMDAALQPWYAPFGLNNGIIRNITDIAHKPNQKQMDSLYRLGINPVTFFQGDGFAVWGQKTLQAKPSAFDRLNVRRLFLVMERATLKIVRYFVAEPNSVFTRTRVNNVLKPIFDLAKNNEGCYDYLIVCDERNNTANVIENNEMAIDIYIKPVKTAEFILCTFYATRTDANFSELIK